VFHDDASSTISIFSNYLSETPPTPNGNFQLSTINDDECIDLAGNATAMKSSMKRAISHHYDAEIVLETIER
jgi:hypothetical protein